MSLLFAKYKWLAIGIALAVAAVGLLHTGYRHGVQSVQSKWDQETAKRKQDENAAILTAMLNNERKAEQDKLNSQRIAKENKRELDKIRADLAAARLRVGPAFCPRSAEAVTPNSPSSSDGADTGARLLPEEVERDIRALIEETERVAATGRAAQDFIRSNGMAPD